MEGVKSFTNIDIVDFVGKYGGEDIPVKKGKTKVFPETIANHIAGQLATKILMRKKKDYLGDPERPTLIKQILGGVVATPEKKEKAEKETKKEAPKEAAKKEEEFEDLPPGEGEEDTEETGEEGEKEEGEKEEPPKEPPKPESKKKGKKS